MARTPVYIPDNSVGNDQFYSDDPLAISNIAQRALAEYPISLIDARVHDAPLSVLAAAATADDLGIAVGTFGTNAISLLSSDGASTTVTQYARFPTVKLPPNYETGESVKIRVHVDMATVSDTTATVDVQAYKSNENAGVGSDLVTTSATSCNSTTESDKDFGINASGLVAGDELDVRIAVAITDSATPSGVTVTIGKVSLLCDTRG